MSYIPNPILIRAGVVHTVTTGEGGLAGYIQPRLLVTTTLYADALAQGTEFFCNVPMSQCLLMPVPLESALPPDDGDGEGGGGDNGGS